MRTLNQLGQPPVSFDKVISVAFGVGGCKTDPLKPINRVNGIQQLHKRGLALQHRQIPPPIAGDDLPKKGHFLNPARHQRAYLIDDLRDRAAAFGSPGEGDDAEGAVLITALHDTDKRSNSLARGGPGEMLPDSPFAAGFLSDINNLAGGSRKQLIKVLSGMVDLLGPQYEANAGHLLQELRSPALGHTA
ncbi:hypothetical protein SDC9_159001 [bioreactor metagenome]|uniref:Uncharacterized protein n=1 Tax=bioreactor metagenome TaxID=1076179 RepID=A0A645FGT0_9ZZZZ